MHTSIRLRPRFQVARPKTTIIKPSRPTALPPGHESIYWIGHSVTLFVGFYCGLQWLHYREIREHIEKDQKKDPTDE